MLVIDYTSMVIDYTFKIQISNPFKKLICKLVFWWSITLSSNRLPEPWHVGNNVLSQKLILNESWSNTCLLKQSCLNLEVMLNLWMFVEVILKANLFDYSLTSSKSCIYTFTISPFLMMTIIIKWILLSIIKTCIIHILPLFDDENNYQANSFRCHQNM